MEDFTDGHWAAKVLLDCFTVINYYDHFGSVQPGFEH